MTIKMCVIQNHCDQVFKPYYRLFLKVLTPYKHVQNYHYETTNTDKNLRKREKQVNTTNNCNLNGLFLSKATHEGFIDPKTGLKDIPTKKNLSLQV